MDSAAALPLPVEPALGSAEAGSLWRPDLDPGALPPTPRHSAGQRRVMRAGLVHFAARGYGGSTVRDIAATLGMQAASVYKHFPSKEAVLLALVELGYDYHHEVVVNAALAAGSTPAAQLDAFVRAHVRLHCDYSRLSHVVHSEWTHLPLEDCRPALRQSERTDAVLRGIVERGRADGLFEVDELDLTVIAITGLGLTTARWFPYQLERSADDVVSHFAGVALGMCRFHEDTQ